MTARSTLEVDIGTPGASDRLALTGALTLGARTGLWVKVAPGATPGGSYTIVTHGGARSGEFVLLDALAGTRLDYTTLGQIRIVIDPPGASEKIIFPAGANVVNVTLPPYNAVPNDGLDDTAAIQTALSQFPNGGRIIYLPNGTYDVSNTLSWPAGTPGASDYKRTVLQGQSRDGAILRLKNNAPLFQNPAARRAVIFTGPAPAQRFGNEVRTLTMHTGAGNPGASGIQFHANNYGGMKRVKIINGDGQGVSGLDFHFTAEIGPLFVQDLEVTGFDHGVRTGDAINGIVLERVTVRGRWTAIVLQSERTLIVRDGEVESITSTSSADLFIEDIVTGLVDLLNPRQHVWARQLNTENGDATNVINNGATLWILGMKTERGRVKIETRNGGFSELLGAHIFSTTGTKTTPILTIDDAAASFACVAESNFEGTQYSQWVRETRGATTNLLADTSVPFRTSANGRAMTLYTGFDGAPKRPLDATSAAFSPTSIALTWSDQSWDETTFQIERSPDGLAWSPLATSVATTFTDATATPGATLRYRIRAMNATAASAPTASISATTPTLFQAWLASFGLPADADPQSDGDRDGLGLFLEYALGGTPSASDSALLPVAARRGGTFTLTYRRERPELAYLVETTAELAPSAWTSTGVDQSVPGAIVTGSFSIASETRRFRRLTISTAP